MAKAQAPGAKGPHLESQQEEEGFDTVETAVHKVSHEEVVGLGDIAAYSEQFLEVVELSMDVTTYLKRKNGG